MDAYSVVEHWSLLRDFAPLDILETWGDRDKAESSLQDFSEPFPALCPPLFFQNNTDGHTLSFLGGTSEGSTQPLLIGETLFQVEKCLARYPEPLWGLMWQEHTQPGLSAGWGGPHLPSPACGHHCLRDGAGSAPSCLPTHTLARRWQCWEREIWRGGASGGQSPPLAPCQEPTQGSGPGAGGDLATAGLFSLPACKGFV